MLEDVAQELDISTSQDTAMLQYSDAQEGTCAALRGKGAEGIEGSHPAVAPIDQI